jgi:hypothetical protein
MQDGFFLRKKPVQGITFPLHQLENRYKARSRTLIPSEPDPLHLAKYECTMRHLGNPSGSIRHWQPLLSRYDTALNTLRI